MGLPCDFVLAPACCVDVDLIAAPGRENALINKRAYKISKQINRTDSGIPKGSRPWANSWGQNFLNRSCCIQKMARRVEIRADFDSPSRPILIALYTHKVSTVIHMSDTETYDKRDRHQDRQRH